MSIGVFMSLGELYSPTESSDALSCVNQVLAGRGCETLDPPAPSSALGASRADCDQLGSQVLAGLGKMAGPSHAHAALLGATYTVFFLPREFGAPLAMADQEPEHTDGEESFFRGAGYILLGSSVRLRAELLELAPALNIPLESGVLDDDTARRLNREERLLAGDDRQVTLTRLAWLMIHEAALLSVRNDAAFCISA